MDLKVSCDSAPDFTGLGAEWRELEVRSAGHSFFQSWTWIGCLSEERYADPLVVRVHKADRLVGIALFGRRGRRMSLAESCDARMDALFIEHNAPLLAHDAGANVGAALMRAAWDAGAQRLILSGVPPEFVQQGGGVPFRLQARTAPFVDLAAVRRIGGDYLRTLSANTRYQVRRSLRYYGMFGDVRLERAATVDDALNLFECMVTLHTATWNSRGMPGAYADEFIVRFHRALLARAVPRGELDLMRIAAGSETIGVLENFRTRGLVYAYQSGFGRAAVHPHAKPGLTCHCVAIQHALSTGADEYDFLAGDSQYKQSLSSCRRTLHWAELVRRRSVPGMVARLRWWS